MLVLFLGNQKKKSLNKTQSFLKLWNVHRCVACNKLQYFSNSVIDLFFPFVNAKGEELGINGESIRFVIYLNLKNQNPLTNVELIILEISFSYGLWRLTNENVGKKMKKVVMMYHEEIHLGKSFHMTYSPNEQCNLVSKRKFLKSNINVILFNIVSTFLLTVTLVLFMLNMHTF